MRDPASSELEPFPSTHWTLVGRAAGRESTELKRAALGELLRRYMGPMRSHLIRRLRVAPDRADDLLQGFLTSQVLERDLIGRAEREKGKFRSFLLVALDRYVMNQRRAERAKKRASERAASLDEGDHVPATSQAAPDEQFDRSWAREVLQEALRRMDQSCAALSRAEVWGVFQSRVLGPTFDGAEPAPYAELVELFHFASPSQASNALITAKRMFARCLRSVIAEYELDEATIDSEVADLREILSRPRA